MSNITLGQVGAFILGAAALIGAISAIVAIIVKMYGKTVGKSINTAVKPLSDDILALKNEMHEELEKSRKEFRATANNLDASECRNFLVRFLGDIERGVDIDPVEIERAYDIIQHYTEDLGQNSYIHARWDEVMQGRSKAASLKKYVRNEKKK